MDAVLDGIKMWKVAFPDMVGTVTNIFGSENQVVAEITWEGTQTGPLMGPMGVIEPTGKRGTTSAVQVFVFEGNEIKAMRHYFDMASVIRQTGTLRRLARSPRGTGPSYLTTETRRAQSSPMTPPCLRGE
jgi:predicted ester cyclase